MDKPRWPLGINTCGDLTLEALDIIAEAGFSHVYVDHLNWDHPEADRSAEMLASRPWLIAHGCHLTGFLYTPTGVPRTPERVITYFTHCIELVGNCGIPNATVDCGTFVEWTPAEFQAHTWGAYDEIVGILRELCTVADRFGMNLNLENCIPHVPEHRFLAEPEEIVQLIADVGAANLRTCLDTGHVTIAGGDPAEYVRVFGEHFGETHFQDNFASSPYHSLSGLKADLHRPPGIGLIDWPRVMDALLEIGYQGPVVFELGRFWEADTLRTHAETTYRNWRRLEEAWHMMRARTPAD